MRGSTMLFESFLTFARLNGFFGPLVTPPGDMPRKLSLKTAAQRSEFERRVPAPPAL